MPKKPTLSKLIRSLRAKSGLSQEALGAELGVPQHVVSRWESGHHVPQALTLQAMAKILGVTTDHLIDHIA